MFYILLSIAIPLLVFIYAKKKEIPLVWFTLIIFSLWTINLIVLMFIEPSSIHIYNLTIALPFIAFAMTSCISKASNGWINIFMYILMGIISYLILFVFVLLGFNILEITDYKTFNIIYLPHFVLSITFIFISFISIKRLKA